MPESVREPERKNLIKRLLPKFVDQKLLYLGVLQTLPEEADIEMMVEQAAKEFDKNALPEMIERSGLKSPGDFDAQLRAQGHSLRKFRDAWSRDQLTKYFLSQQLKVDTEVTHQQMLDAYRERLDEYAIPARARWEQIMIRFDRSESREQAEQRIEELLDQVVYGANLAALAKKNSHGFRAAEGGQHDWTSKGALVLTELDEAIFSLPVGELSKKMESADGFHVVRVLERTDATHKPFLEAQVEIKKQLEDAKRNEAFQEHLEKLKAEIPVEYFQVDDPSVSPSIVNNDAK